MLSLAVSPAVADDISLFDKAVDLGNRGLWSEAARLFAELSERNPEQPEPANNLAVAMLKLGKVDTAKKNLEYAVKSQQSFKVAQENRQKLYDYLASRAYSQAVGVDHDSAPPELQLLATMQVATAPPPVVEPEPAPRNDGTLEIEDITRRVTDWSQAWEKGDTEHYLEAYAPVFKPSDGVSYERWRYIRVLRLSKNKDIDLDISNISVFLDNSAERAIVKFKQDYRSSSYADSVIKQLDLVKQQNVWLIEKEQVVETL